MKMNQSVGRRSFLKNLSAAGAALSFPSIVSASAMGADGNIAPSNRLVMGAIGLGGMGTGDLMGFLREKEVHFVGVCDVDKAHRDRAKTLVDEKNQNQDCIAYLDYRELIGRGDLDAMMIATPDHWHTLPAIAAAKAGLDIHAQKPLARSIREGRAICDAVHRYGRVWQTGSQQRSERKFRYPCELVRNGRIGKVYRVEVGLPTGSATGEKPTLPVPAGLDWDFWLGPAPWRPYCDFSSPGRGPHGSWRWIMDYSGGQLTDWAGHHIDIAQWGLGFEKTGPVEIEGSGLYPDSGFYNVPMEYRFKCKYANGIELDVANNKVLTQGAKWYGEDGWIHVNRGGYSASDPAILNDPIGPDEIHLYESPGHKRNFLDCIKTRSETVAPVEIGHRSISVALLGEIAMLTGRKIKWDPDTERIIGDPTASALLGRSYRGPWTL